MRRDAVFVSLLQGSRRFVNMGYNFFQSDRF